MFAEARMALAHCCIAAGVSAGDTIKCGECDCTMNNTATSTLNCSRRNLDEIPKNWGQGLELLNSNNNTYRNMLITFYGNRIGKLHGLPAVSGGRVAISFRNNRIDDIEDDAFQNITDLIYLDLGYNLLTGAILRSEIFRGAYDTGDYAEINLETLNLSHNKLHSLDMRLFDYTPRLKRLYLDNNPLEMLDHVTALAIASAVNLEVLDLSYTQIDSIPGDMFTGLGQLRHLDISGNRLASVPESLALVGSSLLYLTFNNNPVEQLNDDSFLGLKNLKELEVSENDQLEEVRRSTFSPLRSLKVLHLCHNKNLRYISHNAFRNLREEWTIEEIYLDDNDLSELPMDLLPWDRLSVLGLTGNNWLCNCDLANIVVKQGAGAKFIKNDIPMCIAPMRLSGRYLTDIPLDYCPEHLQQPKKNVFTIKMKYKYVVWGLVGVATVVIIGTILGLLVNLTKKMMHRYPSHETIRYYNINSERHV